MSFNNSVYTREGNSWNASTLYSFAKDKGYKVEEIPLQDISLNATLFPMNNFEDFILEVKMLLDCSLEYPIIIDDRGIVADGYHRICKAIIEEKKSIKAIRLLEMPKPDMRA